MCRILVYFIESLDEYDLKYPKFLFNVQKNPYRSKYADVPFMLYFHCHSSNARSVEHGEPS